MDPCAAIPGALDALRAGRFLIVVDDEQRENEGDLVLAAGHVTEEKMAFIIRHTGGVVCLALDGAIADKLDLPPMVRRNTSHRGTPFTVSIEAARGVTTGISARDRAETVRAAIDPAAVPADLARPGHVFPLRAHAGGVLSRAGHTEAGVDLCRMAGVRPGAVISELMHDDGTMMRLPAIEEFASRNDIPIITIADIIAERRRTETLVRREAEADLETETGPWRIVVYSDALLRKEHVALVKGTVEPSASVLVRVHSECLTGDVFRSRHCDCNAQFHAAMRMIAEEGRGVVLYMRQEGRGIGLVNKIKAYALQQNEGLDTVEANEKMGLLADLREYGIGAQILRDLGVERFRLLTNNPRKVVGLEGYGLCLVERIPLEVAASSEKQKKYLQTKKIKLGHALKLV